MRPKDLLVAVAIAIPILGATAVDHDRSRQAQALVQEARRRLAIGTIDQRRIAVTQLEQALRLVPDDVSLRIELGNVYLERGFLHAAANTYRQALRQSPRNADAMFGLGRVWQADWLDTGDFGTLLQAIRRLEAATRARPRFCEAWTALAALRFEKGDPDGAFDAATSGWMNAPECTQAQMSAAYLAYRTGQVTLADSLFHVVLPHLEPDLQTRFSDISPLISERQAATLADSAAVREEVLRRFWSENNPDPTDRLNLAQLEFWSRLAHATLLLGDPWSPRWERRTAHYARYGRKVQITSLMGPRHYEMPRIEWGDVPDPPTPEALASLGQVTSREGLAIFAPLPPRVRELPMASRLASFPKELGAHVVAGIQLVGTAHDDVTAQCVVLDESEREVTRSSRRLSVSGCDPGELLMAEFPIDLPAGRYRIALAVRNGDDRAVRRVSKQIHPTLPGLEISHVVLTCGLPERTPSSRDLRLDMNIGSRVVGDAPLFAYFEIEHLRTDAGGGNRFRYEYAVKGDAPRKRGPPLPSFSTLQEGFGSVRRQFIRVPMQTLEPGQYSLVLTVMDLISGERAEGEVEFERSRR